MRDDRGQVLPWIVVMIVVLVSMAGAVIDLGNAWRVHEQLQASADAAAAAGADNLPNQLAAVAAAKDYSSTAGGKNPIKGVGSVTTAAYADCSTDPAHCDGANTVHVTESVPVKTTFLGLLGINSINETAKASACSPCGGAPLDVMIVLDRTGSMTGAKLQNAKDGIKAFLGTMDPTLDNVGLAILPPAASTGQACDPVPPSPYSNPAAAYLLVPLSNSYASKLGQLNPSSQLVSTVNCVQAGGSTAYATALDVAQSELNADGRPGVQDVIIILSDGAANDGPRYLPPTSPYRTQPCHTAINIANASKAKNVLMYAIAYDITGSGSQFCDAGPGSVVNGVTVTNSTTPEAPFPPGIKANYTLQQIASPTNYYQPSVGTDLAGIFKAISADISAGTSRING